jgi:hypothetical protein
MKFRSLMIIGLIILIISGTSIAICDDVQMDAPSENGNGDDTVGGILEPSSLSFNTVLVTLMVLVSLNLIRWRVKIYPNK